MRLGVFAAFLISAQLATSQVGDINLYNPSFEDVPMANSPPRGWIDCGFTATESPPDVQPSGDWRVFRPAYHGHTYLGMVTRENNTWESVGQRLTSPLVAGKCYSFSIYLCMSSEYWSLAIPDSIADRNRYIQDNPPDKNFNTPIVLRVVGGTSYCDAAEVLAESEPVKNTYWQKYSFKFEPKSEISHVILQAYYRTPALFSYNGNVLVDHASVIRMTPCQGEEEVTLAPSVEILQPIEKVDPKNHRVKINATIRNINSRRQINFKVNGTIIKQFDFDPSTSSFTTLVYLEEGKNNIYLKAKNLEGEDFDETSVYIRDNLPLAAEPDPRPKPATPTPGPEPKVAQQPIKPKPTYRLLEELNEVTPEAGQVFKVKGLEFLADSSRIETESENVLNELYTFLSDNPDLKVEIGGHTNGVPAHEYCDRLSRARAESVATYLRQKGIEEKRIIPKGYGKRFPVASNETKEGRTKNQRVEIKILSTS